MGTTIILLTGVAAALLGVLIFVLILRMGRKLATFLLVAGGLFLALLVAAALLSQGAANYQAAQASKEALKAVKAVNAGFTISTLALGAMLMLLLLAIGFVWQTWRLRAAKGSSGKWTPGPNALWGRTDDPMPALVGEAWIPLLMGQMMAFQQMLVGLLAGDARSHRSHRLPGTWNPARQTPSHNLLFTDGDGWGEWGEPWGDDVMREEELWGVDS